MNVRIITDSINLGIPDTIKVLVQQNGHAGRDLKMNARGWTYVEPAVVALAQEDIEEGASQSQAPKKNTKATKNSTPQGLTNSKSKHVVDEKVKAIVKAHIQGLCIIVKLNRFLRNVGDTAHLPCEVAKRRLPCSSCEPFWNAPYPAPMPPGYVVVPILETPTANDLDNKRQKITTAPLPTPLVKKHRLHAEEMLKYFAEQRLLAKDTAHSHYAPVLDFWCGVNLQVVLDNFHLLCTRETINLVLGNWIYLEKDGDALFLLAEGLNAQYEAN
ncbi:hypothetical protein H0H81_004399 [Sphagnurus paluster]|uniref:Uncharacterized protein n=1 Tax=Sphagnurus paluster TaxID=117069 RepID=A0A9P7FNU3_9AGAR|nr:hypothetical protein H0H81_004399 [Sphagnurus paluster]